MLSGAQQSSDIPFPSMPQPGPQLSPHLSPKGNITIAELSGAGLPQPGQPKEQQL